MMKKIRDRRKDINNELKAQNVEIRVLDKNVRRALKVGDKLSMASVTTFGEKEQKTILFLDDGAQIGTADYPAEVRPAKKAKGKKKGNGDYGMVRDLASIIWVDYDGSCCRDIIINGVRRRICFPC